MKLPKTKVSDENDLYVAGNWRIEENILIYLSKEQAGVLRVLLNHVGGDPSGPTVSIDEITNKLSSVGIPHNPSFDRGPIEVSRTSGSPGLDLRWNNRRTYLSDRHAARRVGDTRSNQKSGANSDFQMGERRSSD
jgi:hypothetical protein